MSEEKLAIKDVGELLRSFSAESLKTYTTARIALGHTGTSQVTSAQLDFQLAHAQARDAVHLPLNFRVLQEELAGEGLESVKLHSKAKDRSEYLQRPDLGRSLSLESVQALKSLSDDDFDLMIVIADGLSSSAIKKNAVAFLQVFLEKLKKLGLSHGPIALVEQGRVAVGDEVAVHMKSRMVATLIGERPGLSSPDSLGIYFTYEPYVGCQDSERNCISNIHRNGLSYEEASESLLYLVTEAKRLKYSGVDLKGYSSEGSTTKSLESNFLLE